MDKSSKRRALGRGLGALIPGAERPPAVESGTPTEVAADAIVANPWQPRRRFTEESIEELAQSIREHGIVQPLVVRRRGNSYELIAGERRLRAAGRAGLQSVPVFVREVSDDEMLEIALVENIQREDLNPIEEAEAYRRLADDLGLKQDDIATRVGKNRSTVANSLRLLNFPDEIREALESGALSAGHARAIAMAGSVEEMIRLMRRVLDQKLTVRQTEKVAKAKPADKDTRSPEVREVEERLTRALGTKVRVAPRTAASGSVTIEYYSLEQFEQLLRRVGA